MRYRWAVFGAALLAVSWAWQIGVGQKSGGKEDKGELVQRGSYLVNDVAKCVDCHTPRDAKGEPDKARNLQGAPIDFVPTVKRGPWMKKAPDITAGGLAGEWTEAEMIKLLTTGVNPDGETPHPPMPLFRMHQNDARAVALYLKSLPGGKKEGKKGNKEGK